MGPRKASPPREPTQEAPRCLQGPREGSTAEGGGGGERGLEALRAPEGADRELGRAPGCLWYGGGRGVPRDLVLAYVSINLSGVQAMIVWNRGTRILDLGVVGERECPECGDDEQRLAGTLTTEMFVERVRRGSRQFVEI